MGFYFSNKVDDTKPYYKISVTDESGFLAFGNTWYRGEVIYVQADSDKYEETKDKNGISWIDSKSVSYEVTLLDPNKDAKLKEGVALDINDATEIVSLGVDETEDAPKPQRGRPRKTKE